MELSSPGEETPAITKPKIKVVVRLLDKDLIAKKVNGDLFLS